MLEYRCIFLASNSISKSRNLTSQNTARKYNEIPCLMFAPIKIRVPMFSVIFRPNTNSFRSKFGHNSQIGNLDTQRKYKIQLNAEKSDTSVGKLRLHTLIKPLGCQIAGDRLLLLNNAMPCRFRRKSYLITTPAVDIPA